MQFVEVLAVVAVLGSGIVAGVLFAVALSMTPALAAMPPERYVYAQQLLGRNWDPTMPLIVLSAMIADGMLAALETGTASVLFGVAALLLLGVALVSHLGNVPINRVVRVLDPEAIPATWVDPRPAWRRWNLLRTAFALLGLTANASALALR